MFGDQTVPHMGNGKDGLRYVQNYELYRELMRYPVEFENVKDVGGLCEVLAYVMSEDVGADWRARWIGKAFDGKRFVKLVEEYQEGQPQGVARTV